MNRYWYYVEKKQSTKCDQNINNKQIWGDLRKTKVEKGGRGGQKWEKEKREYKYC